MTKNVKNEQKDERTKGQKRGSRGYSLLSFLANNLKAIYFFLQIYRIKSLLVIDIKGSQKEGGKRKTPAWLDVWAHVSGEQNKAMFAKKFQRGQSHSRLDDHENDRYAHHTGAHTFTHTSILTPAPAPFVQRMMSCLLKTCGG